MRRRQFLGSALGAAGLSLLPGPPAKAAQGAGGGVPHLLESFLALPGTKSAQVDVDTADSPWRATFQPHEPLFCGSCFKTFVLAAYLQEVEAGRADENEQLGIDDSVRSPGGSVFENLTGTTAARNVLEAMIAHSDNTATDAAMKRIGAARVRKLIADAGLRKTRIPDSTRRFFSYVAGAPAGEDLGWKRLHELLQDQHADTAKFRPALNDVSTMVAPADELVAYYKRALTGGFFAKPETLREFKRIHAMADAIAIVVPADTPCYMKGGSVDWNGFHCMASAGQMIVRGTPVTFALTLNWRDSDGDQEKATAAYIGAVADVLAKVNRRLLEMGT